MANTTSYVRVIGNEVDNSTDDTTYVFTPTDGLKTFTLAGNSDNDTVAISALSTDFKVKVVKNLLTLVGLKTGASAGTIVKIQLDSTGGVGHLAFLDGTVGVSFTPSAPGSLTGHWTVGGEDIAKKYNFAKQAGNYSIDGAHTYADAAYAASGILDAERFLLTTDTDDVVIAHDNTYDVVRGIIDYRGEDSEYSTFSTMDNIDGNGHTMVEVGVHDTNGCHDADYVEMSGVDVLRVIDGDHSDGCLIMDASTYGDDISHIIFDGEGGMDLDIENLTVNGPLDVDVSNLSTIDVTGTIDGVVFEICATNCATGETTEAIVGIGLNGIETHSAADSSIYIELSMSKTTSCGDVSVGDLAIASVDLNMGTCASDTMCIWRCASVSCLGDASVGNVAIGTYDINLGADAEYSMFLTQCAYAYCGNATAGDVTIGDMTINAESDGYISEFYVCNGALSCYSGDASVGDMTFGNIDISLAYSASACSMNAYNCASACSGAASAGNYTIGDITITGADEYCVSMCGCNEAYAAGAGDTATLGNLSIGNMDIVVEDSGCVNFTFCNSASASGNVTVGDLTIGNLNLVAGSSGYLDFDYASCAYYAYSCSGVATAGDLTAGDINVTMGIYNTFSYCLELLACGCGDSIVGDATVGDINIYGGADSYVYVMMDVCAYEGTAGNIAIGNVDIQIENDGSNDCGTAYFDLDLSAAKFGDFKIGDLTMVGASGAYLSGEWYMCATDGDIGNVTIGNVAFSAGVTGCVYFCASHSADHDLGNISIGDVTLTANKSACATGSLEFYADYGRMGNISMGDVTLNAAESGCAYLYAYFTADDEIGNASFGDIALNAIGKCADVSMSLEVYNCYDDIGNICYGNISLVADGEDAYACLFISAENDGNSCIGTITAGDIHLGVTGDNAGASLYLSYTSTETTGQVTVGDITIDMASGVTKDDTGVTVAYQNLYICSDAPGVDVAVGDITLTAAEVTASFSGGADVCAYVNLYSCGDLSIGNITVSGGYENAGGVADNYSTLLTWLATTVDGNTTIGNVDYSGYQSTATIDVSGFDGASIIKAAQDDTTITLNDTKNTVYLGDGADLVNVSKNATDATLVTGIDLVYNFTAGVDKLDCVNGDFSWAGTGTNYASFIASATNAFSTLDYEIYAAKFGGDTYVAYNTDGDTDLDFVVKLVGSTANLTSTDVGA